MGYLAHQIIEDMIEAGIEPTITKSGLKIEGFYKSDHVILVPKDDGFIAKARYNEETPIDTFDDLVYLNYDWWQRSKERYDGWRQPDELWAKEMIRLNLVRVKTIPAPATTVYE